LNKTNLRCFFPLERLIDSGQGLAEATLRIRASLPNFQTELLKAFGALYEHWGEGRFDVTYTANVVLQGDQNRRYSLFYGQNFESKNSIPRNYRSYALGKVAAVVNLADVANLRTAFDIGDFEDVIKMQFPNSAVSVHSLVNIVYIIRRVMRDYHAEKTVGSHYTTLY
jgi:hypothetical protein